MRRFLAVSSAAFLLCVNLFAVSVGDQVSYQKNSDKSRTSSIILNATGALKVTKQITAGNLGAGYEVELVYSLDVKAKGPQTGTLTIFVPEKIFAQGFFNGLPSSNNPMALGAIAAAQLGTETAKDTKGNVYNDCIKVQLTNIDPDFAGPQDTVKVVSFTHAGKIEYVTKLEITIKTHQTVPVLGAVEMDIKGTSDSDIDFIVGMDLVK